MAMAYTWNTTIGIYFLYCLLTLSWRAYSIHTYIAELYSSLGACRVDIHICYMPCPPWELMQKLYLYLFCTEYSVGHAYFHKKDVLRCTRRSSDMTHISKNDRPTRRMTLEPLKVPLSQAPKHWLGSNSIFHEVILWEICWLSWVIVLIITLHAPF